MKRFLTVLFVCLILLPACLPKQARSADSFSVLVYITGVIAGSPTYEMLAEGALEFAGENENVTVKIYEAGFNQAEWEEQLKSMVSGGEYDLVIGSNPSLPEICVNVSRVFPSQKFLITDAALPAGGELSGHPQISTWFYNQYEQAFFLGYLAGLITTSHMPFANSMKRIGFIAAQEYPLLTRYKIPAFIEGARLADPDIELDLRLIGNWFDASKAAELTSAMINSGVDVFISNAGGAAQGIIRTIKDRGAYALYFNNNEYSQAPGFVVGCGMIEQKKLVKEILTDAFAGKIQYGSSRTIGVQEGYIDFIFDDPGYRDTVPEQIKEKFESFMENFRAGHIVYTVPPL